MITDFLNLKEIPDDLARIYEAAEREYNEQGVFFLRRDYIISQNERLHAFPNIERELIADAESISRNESMSIYALFVYRAMLEREIFLKHLDMFVFPTDKYLFLSLLCMLPAMENMYRELVARRVPDDIIDATLHQFEDCAMLYEKRFGTLGYSKRYFDHMQLYIDGLVLNIGRLRFERRIFNDHLHLLENKNTAEQVIVLDAGRMRADGLFLETPPVSDTDAFDATFGIKDGKYVATPVTSLGRCKREPVSFDISEWQVRLSCGDECLAVHIPDKGAFTAEACDDSYRRAAHVFAECYPEFKFKAFCCHSWLLSPELSEHVKPESNILVFASKYHRHPIRTKGQDVINFVFYLKSDKYEDLPEDTSLQRSLKALYIRGGYLYEYGGVFTPDRI